MADAHPLGRHLMPQVAALLVGQTMDHGRSIPMMVVELLMVLAIVRLHGNLVPRLPLMVCNNKITSMLVRRHLATLEVILGAAQRHQLINTHPTPTIIGDQINPLPMAGALLTMHRLQEHTCLRQLPQL
jgi:hypothetical protein